MSMHYIFTILRANSTDDSRENSETKYIFQNFPTYGNLKQNSER